MRIKLINILIRYLRLESKQKREENITFFSIQQEQQLWFSILLFYQFNLIKSIRFSHRLRETEQKDRDGVRAFYY